MQSIPRPSRPNRRSPISAALFVFLASGCGGEEIAGDAAPASVVVLPADPGALDPAILELVDEHTARVRERPERGGPHGSLGLVYEANGLWPEALACFERARELAPENPIWHLHAAISEEKLGDLNAAWSSVRAGVERHPEFAPLWGRLGDLALDRGEASTAREAYTQANRLAPGAPEPLVGLGELDLAEGATAAAVERLERAVALDDGYRAAHYVLGMAYRSAGRLEDAQRELELGVRGKKRGMRDPGSAKLTQFAAGARQLVGRSRRLLARGRWADAAELLEPEVLRHPDNARLRLNLGIAWFQLGRSADGVRALEEAAELDRELHMIPFNLAGFHLTLGEPGAALRQAERALELDREFAPSHFLRGRALLALGRLEEAELALEDARRRAPQDAAVHQALGEVAQARGQLDAARAHLRAACELASSDPVPHLALARFELDAGQLEAAAAALAAARGLAADHPEVAELTSALAAARGG